MKDENRGNYVEKYFKLLHPEYESLTQNEQMELLGEKSFIEENIEEIHSKYEDYYRISGISDEERIKIAVKEIKTQIYYKLLHPRLKELSKEERVKAYEDRDFIDKHLVEIEKLYEEKKQEKEQKCDSDIMQEIMDTVKNPKISIKTAVENAITNKIGQEEIEKVEAVENGKLKDNKGVTINE